MLCRIFFILLFTLLVTLAPPVQPINAASDPGAIAYIRDNMDNGTEIHVINPDGSQDHTILTLPKSPNDFVPTLAWKPDATELAFASDHERAFSLFNSDIYTVRPDGSHVRRMTNGPATSRLASYPQGSVTVNVQLFAGGGPYLIYIAGAAELKAVVGSQTVTFAHVADFGPGRIQGVIAINGGLRWFNSAAVDVQPGQTTDAGTLLIRGEGLPYGVARPTWRSDGTKIGFEGGGFHYVPDEPRDGDLGTLLIEPDFPFGLTSLMDWSPAPAKANQILYRASDLAGSHIYLTTEDSNAVGELLYTYDAGEKLLDLKWLPDGSGFVFSLTKDLGSHSNLWQYEFATHQASQITDFPSEVIGALSIAPDSQTIVFERAPDFATDTDLWLVQRDGANLHLLTKSASRPSWSQVTPDVAVTPQSTGSQVYLPLVKQ
jgi:hypothetical protein